MDGGGGTVSTWPTTDSVFKVGDDVWTPGTAGDALRYMYDPAADGASKDFWVSGVGSADVHYTSGVANHFYYLLAEGAVVPTGPMVPATLGPSDLVCNANTGLVGIGRAAAQQIWYKALTVYMTSNTNYAGARVATLSAATDLYGAGSNEYNAVAAAWDAVNVH